MFATSKHISLNVQLGFTKSSMLVGSFGSCYPSILPKVYKTRIIQQFHKPLCSNAFSWSSSSRRPLATTAHHSWLRPPLLIADALSHYQHHSAIKNSIIYQRHSIICSSSADTDTEHPCTTPTLSEDDASPVSPEYCIVNFYHLVDIERPHQVIEQHREYLEDKDVRGRIYISEQGINAQYGGIKKDAVAYAEWLATTQPLFKGLYYATFDAEGHMYPRLRLKYKPNLISLAGGMASVPVTDPSSRATPVKPSEWRSMLSGGVDGRRPLVLDVRNSYEWDAGHFVGAERPLEDEFNQTPTEALPSEVPAYLENADPDSPVMMYCTGGIRCDVYSAYLKQKGFKNLYTLEGGIQNYMREEGLDHWNGSLFVFDGRMAIRPNKNEEAPLEAAVPCQLCGGRAVLPHANCANIDCNKLFIACDACRSQYKGCCCSVCMDAPRLLRPPKSQGQYGNWRKYADGDEEEVNEVMAGGRGEGRISRRRKRQQALKEREMAKRLLKLERRRHAKEMMAEAAERDEGGEEREDELNDHRARIARLRELRARLVAQHGRV